MLDHSLFKLSNGLPVITVPMPGVQSATVLALANTGSRYETKKEQGIAHFFEHIVFKGTKNYPETQALASAVDAIGADFNAFTSKEYTGYYVKSASKDIAVSIDVVSDMLLQPLIRDKDVKKERGVIIEEINMYEDTPMRKIGYEFDRLVFTGSGLGHQILGTKETVSAITAKDFRNFLQKWYGLGNMLLIVAGDESVVTSAETTALLETAFSKNHAEIAKRAKGRVDTKALADKDLKITEDTLHVINKKTEQAHLSLGWHGIEREDERRYALSLLTTVLGANMSSRLFTEVREKRGLCYYVHSDTDFYHNTGIVGASAGVDPSRIDEAIRVILEQFHSVVSGENPITEQELQNAKDYMAGSLVLSLEDSRSVAQYFGLKKLLADEILSPSEVLEKFTAVTLEEVASVAEEIIQPGNARLAVIGPYKSEDRFSDLLMVK